MSFSGTDNPPEITSVATSLSRRRFLAATGVSALGSLATSAPAMAGADVGTQLYGWGQYYERDGKDLWAGIDDALGLIRDCGFSYAESSLDIDRPEQNGIFAAKLRSRGLRPVSLYTGGSFHDASTWEKNIEKTLRAALAAKAAGFFCLSCNPDPIGRQKTVQELEVQAKALNVMGKELRSAGVRLGIHHHSPEMANGAREFHSNFEKSKPGTVDFCYDVHWVYRGGMAPSEALNAYGDRIVTWHLRQSRERIWWEDLAPGDIDYAAIARTVQERQLARYFTVELALEKGTKVTRSVVENHRRSREFVRNVMGV